MSLISIVESFGWALAGAVSFWFKISMKSHFCHDTLTVLVVVSSSDR